jgi:hypothetical protein
MCDLKLLPWCKWDNSSWTAWHLKMGPRGCPKTLVQYYHSMLHKIPKECRSQTGYVAWSFICGQLMLGGECLSHSSVHPLTVRVVVCSHTSLEKCLTKNCPVWHNQDYALARIVKSETMNHNQSSSPDNVYSKCHAVRMKRVVAPLCCSYAAIHLPRVLCL